jgi:hypothetical protein
MTVVALRPTAPATKPDLIHPYVSIQPAARHAMTALEGSAGQLRRILSGGATTLEMAAQIEGLTNDIQVQAKLIGRLTR